MEKQGRCIKIKLKNFLQIVAQVIIIGGLIFWIFPTILTLTGGIFGGQSFETTLDMFLPQFTGFTVIVLIISTVLGLFLVKKRKWLLYFTLVIGLVLIFTNLMPLTSPYIATSDFDTKFKSALGNDYISKIPPELRSQFRTYKFSLWNYYYGFHDFQCNLTLDIPYLKIGNDTFKFDLYRPINQAKKSPVVIAIHGGGWRAGDKGIENMFPLNKYLVSQGYVVCDIQYGLAPNGYNMSDIVSNIGFFTKFLENNSSAYNIDLNKTFFLGRSAGAHLALLSGLGIKSPQFSGIFGKSINVSGIIDFYGPTNLSITYDLFVRNGEASIFTFLMNGTPSSNPQSYHKYSPINIINASAPPILILHGKNDKIVSISESEVFKNKCDLLSDTCILLEFPFGGHGFDYFFQSQYSQIVTYYVERFIGYFSNV